MSLKKWTFYKSGLRACFHMLTSPREVIQQDVVAERRLQRCSTEEYRMQTNKPAEKGNSETKCHL